MNPLYLIGGAVIGVILCIMFCAFVQAGREYDDTDRKEK